MKFDTYTLTARVFPAILSLFPFFALHYFLLSPKLGGFWDNFLGIKIAGDITMALVFLFLIIQVSRFVSKEFFEKRMFDDGAQFPTTSFLLHLNSHFSPEYTKQVHQRIKNEFDIDIPSLSEEILQESRSRKKIAEAVDFIRIKVGKGKLAEQHNIEYGFFRNLAGGSLIALVISIINIIVFKFLYFNKTALVVSCVALIIYGLYLFFAKKIINVVGRNYAKILIQEYMAL